MFEPALRNCHRTWFIICSIYIIGSLQNVIDAVEQNMVDSRPMAHTYLRNIMQEFRSPIIKPPSLSDSSGEGIELTPQQYDKFKIWPDAEIPFYIDTPSFSDKSFRDQIRWFLNEVNTVTKLNFVELPQPPLDVNEKRWVYFINRRSFLGCHDISISNFTTKGVQRVVLGYDCLESVGGLAEIVLALAGVPPQHSSPDRDKYIIVVEDNIIPHKRCLFRKLNDDDWLFNDFEYDFDSAGHFHQHKHSINGSATIKLQPDFGDVDLSGRKGFSVADIKKINLLYTNIIRKGKTQKSACGKLFGDLPQKDHEGNSVPHPDSDCANSDDPNDDALADSDVCDDDADAPAETLKSHTKQNLKAYLDPLFYLSDYQTADEQLKRNLWSKKLF